MDSDLDIARRAEPRPIEEIASKLGLSTSDLIMQGPTVAKIQWNTMKSKSSSKQGFLILVTSVNPCLLYTSPSPRDGLLSRMPSSA